MLKELLPLPTGLLTVLLAQSVTGTGVDPAILSIVGNGVTVVVLAWYVIYDVRVRTPNMLSTFSKENRRGRASYRRIVEEMRATFLAEQNASRSAFAAEQTATRAQYDRELAELRKMLFENMTAMRTAVHDVKDTANALMQKKSLSEMTGESPPQAGTT
jgi:hypothetical protein